MKHLKKFINGPLNVMRLEGKINGIEKVIYIFMDIHLKINMQTKCSDLRSVDIVNYLVDNFDQISEKDKIYDFFFEIQSTDINTLLTKTKKKYIHEIFDLFVSSFLIDRDKNVVSKSNTFPNVRLHYIDIRDYVINYHKALFALDGFVGKVIASGSISKDDIQEIKNLLKINVEEVMGIHDLIYGKRPQYPDFLAKKKYFIDKIRNKYHHKNINQKINMLIDTYLIKKFNDYFQYVESYYEKLDRFSKLLHVQQNDLYYDKSMRHNYGLPNYIKLDILKDVSQINEIKSSLEREIFVYLVDLFFLRRFLDKDYITNGIIYTGISHSSNYIFTLIKYFDFKITHYSYLKGTLEEFYELIKKADDKYDVESHIYPPKLVQCSDMTSFPKLFL
jgi:hypothetical protein